MLRRPAAGVVALEPPAASTTASGGPARQESGVASTASGVGPVLALVSAAAAARVARRVRHGPRRPPHVEISRQREVLGGLRRLRRELSHPRGRLAVSFSLILQPIGRQAPRGNSHDTSSAQQCSPTFLQR
jgi:hypothetical protein